MNILILDHFLTVYIRLHKCTGGESTFQTTTDAHRLSFERVWYSEYTFSHTIIFFPSPGASSDHRIADSRLPSIMELAVSEVIGVVVVIVVFIVLVWATLYWSLQQNKADNIINSFNNNYRCF
jgi:hypothetical protein